MKSYISHNAQSLPTATCRSAEMRETDYTCTNILACTITALLANNRIDSSYIQIYIYIWNLTYANNPYIFSFPIASK